MLCLVKLYEQDLYTHVRKLHCLPMDKGRKKNNFFIGDIPFWLAAREGLDRVVCLFTVNNI